MSLFKKKEKEKYLFAKTISYRGYVIQVYAKEDCYVYSPMGEGKRYLQTGYNILEVGGIYNTGISPERLQDNLQGHIDAAKNRIDNIVEAPQKIADAINGLKL